MSSISSSPSWVIRDQVPFDAFISNVAFAQISIANFYDSLQWIKEEDLEAVGQFIERCRFPTEEEDRLQKRMPRWFYIPFCEILFNNNVSPGRFSNAGFVELPEWEGEQQGPLGDCWPYASLMHVYPPIKLADLARASEILFDNILLPLFFPSDPPVSADDGIKKTTTTTTTTTTKTGTKEPVEAQNKFARYILTNTHRKFLITMVFKEDASLQLWYHTRMGESIPSTFISFRDPQNLMPLYRLMWRLASMSYKQEFGVEERTALGSSSASHKDRCL